MILRDEPHRINGDSLRRQYPFGVRSGMSQLIVRPAAEQVAAHLREEILEGIWEEHIPGGHLFGGGTDN